MGKRPEDYDFQEKYSEGDALRRMKKLLMRRIRVDDICIWHVRLKLFCDEIVERLDLPPDARFLDLGCSIGTFAIEMAGRGRDAVGIDLSHKAIDFARVFTSRLGLKKPPRFAKGDVSDEKAFPPESFDVIMAMDIFEHLHEDLLQQTVRNCALWLKPGGYLVYHTSPSKYDYLFHSRKWKSTLALVPLIPFLIHGERKFKKAVERYHRYVMNPVSKLMRGKTHEERILNDRHCNLLTAEHVEKSVESAGLVSVTVKTANLYKRGREGWKARLFGNREYYHRDIYGIAWKRLKELG